MCTIPRSSSTRHETIRSHSRRRDDLLRPRPEDGYATPSHWHGLSRIELNSSADLAESFSQSNQSDKHGHVQASRDARPEMSMRPQTKILQMSLQQVHIENDMSTISRRDSFGSEAVSLVET
jgi:hypothetical protein